MNARTVLSVDRGTSAGVGNGHAEPSPTGAACSPGDRTVEHTADARRARQSGNVGADWDALFGAVLARLRHASGSPVVFDTLWRDPVAPLRTILQECVGELDQLRATLVHELGLRQQLELEVFDARTELAQARAELTGTQAGERRARHLALHDSLTSLPNRTYFRERLDGLLALGEPLGQPLAVLYLDLDGFKPINDTHGHDVGDELLRIIAARMSRAVRGGDMVSRLGGDEFACLLANLPGRQQLSQLACKVFDAVSAPLKVGKLRLTVRPSIGIAICPTDGATADALLKSADAAMYAAKREQSGYAFFTGGNGSA